MNDKILVIISSGDKGKVITGLMYATNAIKYTWMGEIKVVVFGPSQALSLKDPDIQAYLKELVEKLGYVPDTCKYIADSEGLSKGLSDLGLNVVYVGAVISDHIKRGFIPLVF